MLINWVILGVCALACICVFKWELILSWLHIIEAIWEAGKTPSEGDVKMLITNREDCPWVSTAFIVPKTSTGLPSTTTIWKRTSKRQNKPFDSASQRTLNIFHFNVDKECLNLIHSWIKLERKGINMVVRGSDSSG